MTSPLQLVLVRHGQSVSNRWHRLTGWDDVELTARGRRQAHMAGERLLNAGFGFDVAYTSKLRRARETLELMLQAMARSDLPVESRWRLNERHYGALEGYGPVRATAKFGLRRFIECQLRDDVAPPALDLDDPRFPGNQAKYKGVAQNLLPRTETLLDAVERVAILWQREIRPALESRQRVLLVAHNNILGALMRGLSKADSIDSERVKFASAAPLILEFDEALRLRAFTTLT